MSWDARTIGDGGAAMKKEGKYVVPEEIDKIPIYTSQAGPHGTAILSDDERDAIEHIMVMRFTGMLASFARSVVGLAAPAAIVHEGIYAPGMLIITAGLAFGTPFPPVERDFELALNGLAYAGTSWYVKHVTISPLVVDFADAGKWDDGERRQSATAVVVMVERPRGWQLGK